MPKAGRSTSYVMPNISNHPPQSTLSTKRQRKTLYSAIDSNLLTYPNIISNAGERKLHSHVNTILQQKIEAEEFVKVAELAKEKND